MLVNLLTVGACFALGAFVFSLKLGNRRRSISAFALFVAMLSLMLYALYPQFEGSWVLSRYWRPACMRLWLCRGGMRRVPTRIMTCNDGDGCPMHSVGVPAFLSNGVPVSTP